MINPVLVELTRGISLECCAHWSSHENVLIQQEIVWNLEALTGYKMNMDQRGTDGCSIPTYAIPLKNLAHGFAKMAPGQIFAKTGAEGVYTAALPELCLGIDDGATCAAEVAIAALIAKCLGSSHVATADLQAYASREFKNWNDILTSY